MARITDLVFSFRLGNRDRCSEIQIRKNPVREIFSSEIGWH